MGLAVIAILSISNEERQNIHHSIWIKIIIWINMVNLTEFSYFACIMQIRWKFAFRYLIPYSIFKAFSVESFCQVIHSF